MSETVQQLVQNRLGTALRIKSAASIIDVQVTPGQVRILARQPQARIGDLVLVIQQVLMHMEEASWKVDISKPYFLKEGKVVQGVRIILQTQDPLKDIEELTLAVETTTRSRGVELDDVPLAGNPNRHVQKNGKGAGPLGSIRVGSR